MKKSLIALVGLAALTLAPAFASAGGSRFGTDRGARYSGRSGSSSFFGVSVGFGSSSYHRGGGGYYGGTISYGRGYGGYAPRYYPRYSSYAYDSCYYRPSPVVYCPPPAPVIVAPAPVVYAPPPVVYYSAPRVYTPVYTSSYYYSSGGYYCGR